MDGDDIANVVLKVVPGLLDSDSLRVDWNWDQTRFPNGAEDARRVIQAMNVLQVCLCLVLSHTNTYVSCLQVSVESEHQIGGYDHASG